MFQDYDKHTYTLNMDNSVTEVSGGQYSWVTTLFPSASDTENISNGVFKDKNCLVKDGKCLDTSGLIKLDWYYSVFRVYRDVFLAHDNEVRYWVLIRILVS